MARRVKPSIKYKKNKKSPKAVAGAATLALGLGKSIFGARQAKRAKEAEAAFDKSRLERGVSSATQKMADQPIDQSYINQLQQQQASDRASAMGALAKDPRNVLAGVQNLEGQAAKQRTALLGMQQDAKTKAMENLAKEQGKVEDQRLSVAESEIAGIKAEKSAGQQNIYGGFEDIGSGISEGGLDQIGKGLKGAAGFVKGLFQEGGKIDSEDGGVTPGKFDHDTNPLDLH